MTILIKTGVPKSLDKKRTKRAQEIKKARAEMLSKYKTKYDGVKVQKTTLKSSSVYVRETPVYPSLNSDVGTTEAKVKKEYTGTKLVGIATMHKSNMVPVFSKDEAEQISKMRRN